MKDSLDEFATRCRWCQKTYRSSGVYANHVRSKHPDQYHHILTGDKTHHNPTESPSVNYKTGINGPCFDSDEEHLDEEFADNPVDTNTGTGGDQHFPPARKAGKSFGSSQDRTQWDSDTPFPFHSDLEYKLARFFHKSKVPKSMVGDFFKDGLAPTSHIGFRSGHTLNNLLDSMIQTPTWNQGKVDFRLQPGTDFYLRNIVACVQYLISQPAFAKHMSWAPVRATSYDGTRVYSELNTGDWWWETQVSEKFPAPVSLRQR